jgi:nicotinamidase-related amidase
MSEENSVHNSLVNVDDSCLIVIDVQKVFLEKLPEEESEQLIKRLLFLVNVATRLEIPLVVTAEDIDKNGSITPELDAILPIDTYIHNKMIFGLAADPNIASVIKETNRNVSILVGLETDVCVAQSAIGLLGQGYQVVVVEDACASPGKSHSRGLERMRNAGVLVSNVKSLFYEWLRTVEDCREFYSQHKDDLGDPGVQL